MNLGRRREQGIHRDDGTPGAHMPPFIRDGLIDRQDALAERRG
jgi:hypothetical protein